MDTRAGTPIRIDRLTLGARRARIGEHELLGALIIDLERATSADDVLVALRLPDRVERPAVGKD